MSPQFVDFNQDGRLDIVAGIFDGSPHVAWGVDGGWQQPVQILDREGQRIVLNQFWNYETEEWDSTERCNPEGSTLPRGQCTSAFAWDWDDDGDLDLLIGDYDTGHLYLRMNGGKPGEHQFASVNVPVMAGGVPLLVPDNMATPRMVDWDRDGLLDLICGSIGDRYGEDEGGGVYLFKNTGKRGAPAFALPVALVKPTKKAGVDGPVRPDAGLYMDVTDWDGDSDLDLIVGGYSMWKPAPRVLTEEEQERVRVMQADMAKLNQESNAFTNAIEKELQDLPKDVAKQKRKELWAGRQSEWTELKKRRTALSEELDALVPAQKEMACVWLYENASAASKAVGAPVRGVRGQ